ncbi:hypothetical protein NC651_016687 [Populus alba x Populus x berolinensis]|nr:hypothetical protein NC651_016687 [Populus alba x Populus x berolinensis]
MIKGLDRQERKECREERRRKDTENVFFINCLLPPPAGHCIYIRFLS